MYHLIPRPNVLLKPGAAGPTMTLALLAAREFS